MPRLLRALAPLPLLAVTLTVSSITAPLATGEPEIASSGPEFSVMTTASAVASRSDRRPLAGGLYDRRANTTFISWSGRNADTYVQAYNHAGKTWTAPKKIDAGQNDSHNYPTMVQANDGHLLILRGMHNVATVASRSERPHSIDGQWTSTVVAQGAAASYPMPFKTARGDIFMFYRETTDELDPSAPADTRPMKYIVSRDNGKTWKSSVRLTGQPFAIGSTARADNMNEIYIGQLRYERGGFGRPERVHIVYTLAGGGPTQHKHDVYHRNIYYAWFNPTNLRFYSASGRDLGTQIDDAAQERYLKVVQTPLELPGGIKSPDYIQQVGWLPGNRPFVLWFQADNDKLFHNYTGFWNGRRWEVREVATGLRTREIEQVSPVTWRVYATRDDQPNIETFQLACGRWQPETVIATPKPVQRIELITNFRDPARILATGASSQRDVAIADGDVYVAGLPRG